MRFFYVLLSAIVFANHFAAAQVSPAPSIEMPAMGFVFDPDLAAVRPILGFPGAALLGDPLNFGFPVASAAMAPGQKAILAASSKGGQVGLIHFSDGGMTVRLLNDALNAPERMVFSPSGRVALLHKKSSHSIQIIHGLPEAPVAAPEMPLPDSIDAVSSLGISDDGEFVLLIATGGNSDSVWLLKPDTGPLQLFLPNSPIVVSFIPKSHDALALSGRGNLYLLRSDTGFSEYLSTPLDTSSDPVAMQLSPDGARAYIAYTKGIIAVVNLVTGTSSTLSCDCRPTGMHLLNSRTTFRLTDPSALPMLLLDASDPQPRIWFVPAERRAPESQGEQE